ncbi:MAG: GHKL domain-containing protein [Bacteroidales bacterium]|nr:GHKL domain-containing protein [Bacteroidales bacterium]
MIFKKFYLVVASRIVILTASIFLFAYLVYVARHEISSIILGALIVFQVYQLIVYVNRTNARLTQFFDSIRYSDFSSTFSDKNTGKSFEKLSDSFNEVIEEFKKSRAEKEEHFNYLQTVVQHVNIGILCFDAQGDVDMYNNAAKRIFKKNIIRNINDLSAVKDDLPETLMKLKAGNKILVKLFMEDEIKQLSMYATEFRMRGKEYVLVAFSDIHPELEEKEIESWQKLIRVLTHEIMNSITPISSLASTVNEMLIDDSEEKRSLKALDDEDVENVENALNTIRSRSEGLLNFVDIYRNLTRIPQPNFRYFRISEAFERIEQLMQPRIDSIGIKCNCRVYPEDLMLTADPDLTDQVFINLILNAIDAVKQVENPEVSLIGYQNQNNRTIIEVADNGTGIKPDIIDKIFMPFFTSKKEGSGIGLSLSRQIMHLHKGSISVKSRPDEGTVFTLTF